MNTRVRALEHLIHGRQVAGVVETVPSYRSLLVYYDPLIVGYAELVAALEALVPDAQPGSLPPSRLVELPACYGSDLGFDLDAVAEKLGLAPGELARLHAGAEYLVHFIGFTPGLPYMGGLPERLAIPRLDRPRTATPPGSIGIGGVQCCIYSVESPGGFWILARTPLRLYDPAATSPVLLRPGDHVRFRMIPRPEYDALAAAVAAGTFAPAITPA